MKKKQKGEYLYINWQRKYVAIITFIMYACAFAIYMIGLSVCKTPKNIWTIVSILSILPASKSMVNLIMFLRFHSINTKDYEEYSRISNTNNIIYELAFTTYEKTYFIDAIACYENTVIGFLDLDKNKKTDQNCINKFEEHLNTVLKNDNYKDYTIKIFTRKNQFIERLSSMNEHFCNSNNCSGILNSLKSVTL